MYYDFPIGLRTCKEFSVYGIASKNLEMNHMDQELKFPTNVKHKPHIANDICLF